MTFVLSAVVLVFLLVLLIGGLTGRVRASCCSAADPARDLRMRAAFEESDPTDTAGT